MSACDGRQDPGQIAMWLDPVEFASLDQGRDDCPVLCASIMSCEERVFAVEGNGTDCAFDGIVIDFDAAITEEQAKSIPVFGDVFQGLARGRFG